MNKPTLTHNLSMHHMCRSRPQQFSACGVQTLSVMQTHSHNCAGKHTQKATHRVQKATWSSSTMIADIDSIYYCTCSLVFSVKYMAGVKCEVRLCVLWLNKSILRLHCSLKKNWFNTVNMAWYRLTELLEKISGPSYY